MKKKGFTLAEILIAITVIGVISAITLPVLMQNTNKQEYVTALKKAYSTLSQVTNQIIAEEGSPKCADGGWACSSQEIYELFKKHINNVKECGSGAGCFEQMSTYKRLSGKPYGTNFETNENMMKLILADGMQINFTNWINPGCDNPSASSYNSCAEIEVDINGAKKPNTFGRDVFAFILKENGLYPAGCDIEETACISAANPLGHTCTCKVLREGAMNY